MFFLWGGAWGEVWGQVRCGSSLDPSTPLVRFLLAPLEIPKLANAQPSNFGPLPYFTQIKKVEKAETSSRKFSKKKKILDAFAITTFIIGNDFQF